MYDQGVVSRSCKDKEMLRETFRLGFFWAPKEHLVRKPFRPPILLVPPFQFFVDIRL